MTALPKIMSKQKEQKVALSGVRFRADAVAELQDISPVRAQGGR